MFSAGLFLLTDTILGFFLMKPPSLTTVRFNCCESSVTLLASAVKRVTTVSAICQKENEVLDDVESLFEKTCY